MRLRSWRILPGSKATRRARKPVRKRIAAVTGAVLAGCWTGVNRLMSPVLRPGAGALRIAERELTPARGLAVVAIAAVVALGGAQFTDYRAVEVGAPEYSSVGTGARAPEIDRRSPRSAHGAWVLAIAIAAALVIALALARNWRLARLLIFLGAAVVAISLAVDAPRGLREGAAGISYQGAKAVLLGGFWVQLFSGATLIVVGPLLAVQLRANRDTRRARRRGRSPRADAAGAHGAPPRSSDAEGVAT